MGKRAATLRRLAEGVATALTITTAEAMLQRIPRPETLARAAIVLRVGDQIDPDALGSRLEALGYWSDDRIDEAGEFGVRGGVIDLFPADAERPVRLDHEEGRISEIRRFDPVTQRTAEKHDSVSVLPATEIFWLSRREPTTVAASVGAERIFSVPRTSTVAVTPAAEAV